MLNQEIDKGAQLQGHMAALRIQQRERSRTSVVRLQHLHQRAIGQFVFDDKPVRLKQSCPVFGQGHAAEHIVGAAEIALGENLPRCAVVIEQPGNSPTAAGQFVLNAFVLRQFVQGLWDAGVLEVVGAGIITSVASSKCRAIKPESGIARTRMAMS